MTPNGPRCRLASVTGRLVVADWPALPIVYVTDWLPPTGPIDLLRPLVPHRRLARIADWPASPIGSRCQLVRISDGFASPNGLRCRLPASPVCPLADLARVTV